MSLIFHEEADLAGLLQKLVNRWGPLDFISERLDFDSTAYYVPEMGSPLRRHFISFEPLFDRVLLPDIKQQTNLLEAEYSRAGQRTINIDPGFLSPENLILATGKNFTHRVYLRDGIFADLTLIYQGKRFHPLEWTFPDYQTENILSLLTMIRNRYLIVLQQHQKENKE
jgi:hypothetical protein